MSVGVSLVPIVFVESSGLRHAVHVPAGRTLMQAAVDAEVAGIVAECGGIGSCAGCHAYVDPNWLDRLPPKNDDETMLIEELEEARPESRLTCQITVDETMEGLIVRVPTRQQ